MEAIDVVLEPGLYDDFILNHATNVLDDCGIDEVYVLVRERGMELDWKAANELED